MNNKKFIAWLAGFIDGEGCFSINLRKEPNSKLGWACYPTIRIVLQEGDRYVLEKIQKVFGGKVTNRNRQKSWRQGSKSQVLWGVYGWKNCLKISKTIKPYLILKSERCKIFIKILKQVIDRKKVKKTTLWDKEFILNICELRDKINLDRSTFRHPNYLDVKALKIKLV